MHPRRAAGFHWTSVIVKRRTCAGSALITTKESNPARPPHEEACVSRGNMSDGSRRNVDSFEDVRSPEFNKAQQSSTSSPHLTETESVENRRLSRKAGNRLGRRCALPSGRSL